MEHRLKTQGYHIFVADRNPNVRDLLRREMTAAGHAVQTTGSGRELIRKLRGDEAACLVIVDPDLPDTDSRTLLTLLAKRFPAIPVIVHAFAWEDAGVNHLQDAIFFVEKNAASIECLKTAVNGMIERHSEIGPNHLKQTITG